VLRACYRAAAIEQATQRVVIVNGAGDRLEREAARTGELAEEIPKLQAVA
jgi:hypothetical protein